MLGIEMTGLHIPGLQAKPVAVMGAFRSGTNYLTYLLEQNYRCSVREDLYGWKHSIIPPRSSAHGRKLNLAPVVAIAKNPLDFLQSLYRYRMQINRNMIASDDWPSFVTGKFMVFYARLDRSPQLHFPNPVAYWNWLYGNLINLPRLKFRSAYIAYEALAAAPEVECDRLATAIGLRRRPGSFVVPKERMGRRGAGNSGTPKFATERDRAFSQLDRAVDFTPDLLDFVQTWADESLLKKFGYTIASDA